MKVHPKALDNAIGQQFESLALVICGLLQKEMEGVYTC